MNELEIKQENKQHLEANIFACALLMPKELFKPKWDFLRKQNLDEDKRIEIMAKEFEVPEWSVTMRLQHLQFI